MSRSMSTEGRRTTAGQQHAVSGEPRGRQTPTSGDPLGGSAAGVPSVAAVPFELPHGFGSWSPADGEEVRPELDEAARHGLLGELAALHGAGSEIDEVAVIAQGLALVGALVGRNAHMAVGSDQLWPNLFVAVVGPPVVGRKGMALRAVRDLVHRVDPKFARERIVAGVRSGEGLVGFVRDEDVIDDERVPRSPDDQRAVVEAPDLADLFSAAGRPATNLAEVLAQAWEGAELYSTARKDPVRSAEACVSVVGHIDPSVVLGAVAGSPGAASLAARCLWVWSQRRQEVALPPAVDDDALDDLADRLAGAAARARPHGGPWALSAQAQPCWEAAYRP